MASKQGTLFDAWKIDKSRQSSEGQGSSRGRGSSSRGRGKQSHEVTMSKKSRGATGKRGRGRGKSYKFQETINLDDDDELCGNALEQTELAQNEVCQAFSASNKAIDLPGFDFTAGQLWIYPTNQPVRDYQFNIVQTALFNNTLVCLPTGLGKTFVAAVVMFNFHRWYPKDIIVFMAPTRPLVTQQLEACHNIAGMQPSKTIELTGQIVPKKRDDLWKTKNIFFLTPQVMQSDISRGSCPVDKVRCVVIDEAHKALGKHSYAQVIETLSKVNQHFRVLALSATPGSDLLAVQQVLKNLLIYRVELRNENSTDILPYTHSRNIEKIVVPLDGYLNSVYMQVLERYQFYTGKLMKVRALFCRDVSTLSRYELLQQRERFRKNPPETVLDYQKGFIEADFATCMSLAHSIDLLQIHGLRSFYSFLHGVLNREKGSASVASELKKNTNFQNLLSEIQKKLNISAENLSFNISNPGLRSLHAESFVENQLEPEVDYFLSHPKMKVIKDIVTKHFATCEDSTRVMIFSEYRDSVQEIGNMLSSLQPLIKPMVFVGQANNVGAGGRGLKQKEQAQVIQRFKNGGYNVLIATCVGEEGLDIGEVDLIICFDASKSPTRSVQRMGRTGRKREGKIIFLLTEGKEEKAYSRNLYKHASVSKNIMDPEKLQSFLYPVTPRMVPVGVEPQCFKMNVVLSSEQQTSSDIDVLDIDDDEYDEDFEQHTKQNKKKKAVVKLPSKRKSSSLSTKKADKIQGSAQSEQNTPTLTQCVEKMGYKKARSQPKVSSDVDFTLTVDDEDDPIPILIDDNSQYRDDNFKMEISEDSVVTDDNYELLCKLFDVEEFTSQSSVPPCVYIAPSKPIPWKQEYNNCSNVLLNEGDLLCLREKVSTDIFLGSMAGNCRCGNMKWREHDCIVGEEDPFADSDLNLMTKTWEDDDVGNDTNIPSNQIAVEKCKNNSVFDCSSITNSANITTQDDDHSYHSNETSWDPDEVISVPSHSSHSPMNELNTNVDCTIRPSIQKSQSKFQFRRRPNSILSLSHEQENPNRSISATDQPLTSISSLLPSSSISKTVPLVTPPCLNSSFLNNSNSHLMSTPSPDLNSCRLSISSAEVNSSPSPRRTVRPVLKKSMKNFIASDEDSAVDEDIDFVKGTSSSENDDENDFQFKPPNRAMNKKDVMSDSEETNWDPNETADHKTLTDDRVFSPPFKKFPLKRRQSRETITSRKADSSSSSSIKSSFSLSPLLQPKTPTNFKSPQPHRNSSPVNDDEVSIIEFTPSPVFNRRRLNSKRRLIASEETPPYKRPPPRRLLQQKRNPFILDEVDVIGADDSSASEMEEEDNEDISCLIDPNEDEEDEHISNTQQQAMYLQSVKDVVPNNAGRIEPPLSPHVDSEYWDEMGTGYENDSFCMDDVEYADVGVYTQAMNLAREELEMNDNGPSSRVLRSRKY